MKWESDMTDCTDSAHPSSARLSPAQEPRPGLPRLLLFLLGLRRERIQLAQLDDHLLLDIGLSRDEARIEAERPIWDAPEYWRR
ncbi:DUF1127 domain-containing protein [Pseudogemmobacter sonorensis]|uniref:DUF1127 domain-containing protein n=1 Tax=Pseudogemmobacter sonorensis TaxID=2989681 RepID=UPI0036B1113D